MQGGEGERARCCYVPAVVGLQWLCCPGGHGTAHMRWARQCATMIAPSWPRGRGYRLALYFTALNMRKRIMCLHRLYVLHLPTSTPTTPTLPAVIWRGLPPPPHWPRQGDAGRPAAQAVVADAVWCAHASDATRCIRVRLRRPCTACRGSWSSNRRCRIAHGGPPARCSQSATEMDCPDRKSVV